MGTKELIKKIILFVLTIFVSLGTFCNYSIYASGLRIEGTPPKAVKDFEFDGKPHSLITGGSLTVKGGVGSIQYSVNDEWGAGLAQIRDAGTYVIKYRGVDGNKNVFAGPYEIGTVKIKPAINKFKKKPELVDPFTYDGEAHPLFEEAGEASESIVEYHYSLDGGEFVTTDSIPKIIDAGTYEVYCETATLAPNYISESTKKETIVVSPKKITDVKVEVETPLTYNGAQQQVKIKSVTSPSVKLTANDYEVVNKSNLGTNAGNYTLKIKGKRNYAFEASAPWTINKLDISDATVTLGPQLYFTGNFQEQTIKSVSKGPAVLRKDDYLISDNKQKDVSENYQLKISGTNINTTGSLNKTFSIKPFEMNNENVDIILGPELTYNEKEQSQIVKEVRIKSNNALINPIYYDVKNNKGIDAKNYTLTVVGKGDVKGSADKAWKINKKVVTGTWSKNEFEYDGTEKEVYLTDLPKCAAATYTGNKQTTYGTYYANATIKINGNDNYLAGKVPTLKWTIHKIKYDMSKVKFESKTFMYDGKEHQIEISGKLPEGVKVSYVNNKLTKVGVLKATAKFTGDENHEPIENLYATIKVLDNLVRKPKPDDTLFIEDGQEKTYYIEPNEHYTVEGNKQTKAGKYQVKVSLNDKKNWMWEDETTDDLYYEFVIRKRQIEDEEGNTITDDKYGFDPDDKLTILYTEYKDNRDFEHLVEINTLLKPHQEMKFAYLVTLTLNGKNVELQDDVNIDFNVNEKFKDIEFEVFNVNNPDSINSVEYSLSEDGKTASIKTNKLDEFVFLDTGSGDASLSHILKILIMCLYTIVISIYYFVLKYRKINAVVLVAMGAYVLAYAVTGLFYPCTICIILDTIAIMLLIVSILLFLVREKQDKEKKKDEIKVEVIPKEEEKPKEHIQVDTNVDIDDFL